MPVFLAWLLFALSAPPAAAQQPRLQNVPCTVRNRQGDYIPNLTPTDFTVREDGVAQKLVSFTTPGADPVSITLLLDTNQTDLDFLRTEKNAAIQFMKQFPAGADSVSLARFDYLFHLVQDFTDSSGHLVSAARSLPDYNFPPDPNQDRRVFFHRFDASGKAETAPRPAQYEAMIETANRMKDRPGRRALIVVSDWSAPSTAADLESVLRVAGDDSVIVYPIMLSVPRTPDAASSRELLAESILRKLAADTGGLSFDVDSDHPLWSLLSEIRKDVHAQYLLSYTPAHGMSGGAYRRIEVTVAGDGLSVHARAGYGIGTTAGILTFPVLPKTPIESAAIKASLTKVLVCALPRPFDPHGGLTFGGMESLLPAHDSVRPSDAAALAIVTQVAETYRQAQSLAAQGVWETEQSTERGVKEFDHALWSFLSQHTKTTLAIALHRSGSARLRVNATWLQRPSAQSRESLSANYLFVSDSRSEWMAWPDAKVYSQTPAGRLVRDAFAIALDRYSEIANYPSDLHIAGRPSRETGARGSARYVILRGHGPAAGLTHEYWVDEDHHLVVLERIRDWVGHIDARLTWTEQTLNATLAPESFRYSPPSGATRTAEPLRPPEPHCDNTFSDQPVAAQVVPSDFTLPDQEGHPVHFPEWKGPVILAFWHTWLFAENQWKALEDFHQSREGRAVQILGYTDEPPEVVSAFLREHRLAIRTVIDPHHSVPWLYPAAPETELLGLQYAPVTIAVAADRKKAIAWPGELSVARLQQLLQAIRVSIK